MNSRNSFVLLLAGKGTRLYSHIQEKKQFYRIEGKELFLFALEAFLSCPSFKQGVLVIDKEDEARVKGILKEKIHSDIPLVLTYGGKDRNESVLHGLEALKETRPDFVFIHDAARPLLSQDALNRLLEGEKNYEAMTLALPLRDSLLKEEGEKISYLNREHLYRVQTPQVFAYPKFLALYEQGYDPSDTDDFSKAVRNHFRCALIPGDPLLFKVTDYQDLLLLKKLIQP